jgi:hypothetical protein
LKFKDQWPEAAANRAQTEYEPEGACFVRKIARRKRGGAAGDGEGALKKSRAF